MDLGCRQLAWLQLVWPCGVLLAKVYRVLLVVMWCIVYRQAGVAAHGSRGHMSAGHVLCGCRYAQQARGPGLGRRFRA